MATHAEIGRLARSREGRSVAVHRPRLKPILLHLSLSILMANVIPGALFYVFLVTSNVWVALVAAMVWCYAAITWHMATGRAASGLLLLTVAGLTVRTIFAFATGGTYLYFLQPVINNVVVAVVFLLSLATARPVVARLAGDFYPMDHEVARRPRVQRLFWNLTLLWAVVCLVKGATTLWLLESQSMATFVAVKSVLLLVLTVVATIVTVVTSTRVARREGLLRPRRSQASPA